MKFRYDINGLRAIAVIAVVLFHFNPDWLPGGFAGVDVFFVISGFLMTRVIFRGFENNSFNLFAFYVARANRIIPALATLCLVLFVFGWFFLNPADYTMLSKHIGSSVGFISNVIYMRESGYFDAGSHEKWLLHTWSLSVEWQFYIIYPIVLMILKKCLSIENIKKFLIIGTIGGFGLNVIVTMKWPEGAFYLLPTRAWEMMFGGIAYIYPITLKDSHKKLTELLGLSLIFLTYFFISSNTPWPGYFALLPVVGTYLVILANKQDGFLTNNIVSQNLGKWSYSIYLWHWPLVVFDYYFDAPNWYVIGISLSIILGYLSHRYIESYKFDGSVNLLLCRPLWVIALIATFVNFTYINNGIPHRKSLERIGFTKEVQEQLAGPIWKYTNNDICLNRYPYEKINELSWWFCMQNKDSNPTILLLGNSFANQLYPGFINNKALSRHTVLSIGTCGVDEEPSQDISSPCFGSRLNDQASFIDNIIKSNPSIEFVIIDGLNRDVTDKTIKSLNERLNLLESNNIKTIIFTPHIKPKFHPKDCFRADIFSKIDCSFDPQERELLYTKFKPLIENISKQHPNILFFEQNDVFCADSKCSYIKDGLPLHRDAGHTSEYGSILLQEYFTSWAKTSIPEIF
ncbi:MAG: acyltransferase [Pseudomonadales bacterium]|nr:acyltransferase [Pseudomonadales bacterium]